MDFGLRTIDHINGKKTLTVITLILLVFCPLSLQLQKKDQMKRLLNVLIDNLIQYTLK